jgi:hypothetical protein
VLPFQVCDSVVDSGACTVLVLVQQIEYLVRQGCVCVLSELLTESTMAMMALEGLERILQVDFNKNYYANTACNQCLRSKATHSASAAMLVCPQPCAHVVAFVQCL